jgi:hypothetical protein
MVEAQASSQSSLLPLALIIGYTPIWRRLLRAVDSLTGLALTLEVVLIHIQAYLSEPLVRVISVSLLAGWADEGFDVDGPRA